MADRRLEGGRGEVLTRGIARERGCRPGHRVTRQTRNREVTSQLLVRHATSVPGVVIRGATCPRLAGIFKQDNDRGNGNARQRPIASLAGIPAAVFGGAVPEWGDSPAVFEKASQSGAIFLQFSGSRPTVGRSSCKLRRDRPTVGNSHQNCRKIAPLWETLAAICRKIAPLWETLAKTAARSPHSGTPSRKLQENRPTLGRTVESCRKIAPLWDGALGTRGEASRERPTREPGGCPLKNAGTSRGSDPAATRALLVNVPLSPYICHRFINI
jgi:hypothetical protein